jgi:hypothetical protein
MVSFMLLLYFKSMNMMRIFMIQWCYLDYGDELWYFRGLGLFPEYLSVRTICWETARDNITTMRVEWYALSWIIRGTWGVVVVYVSFWSWHVHGSYLVCLPKRVWQTSRWPLGAPDMSSAHRTVRWFVASEPGEYPRAASLPGQHRTCPAHTKLSGEAQSGPSLALLSQTHLLIFWLSLIGSLALRQT